MITVLVQPNGRDDGTGGVSSVAESDSTKSASTLEAMELLDLNWDDVLHRHVLPYLSMADLFRLRAVSTGCRDLVHSYFSNALELDVSKHSEQMTTEAFNVLAANTNSLQSFIGDNCGFLEDSALKLLFKNNPKLKIVHLQCCKHLTPASLQPLILNCKGLKVLNLKGCPWVTSGCLQTFALHQTNLQEVHFESCGSLDDNCLEHFFSSFSKMQVVQFAHLHSVTDRTLMALAKYCKNLRNLDISNCSQITDQGLTALAKCPDLQVLRVSYCAGVRSGTTTELSSRFDRVRIEDKRPPPPPGWCIRWMPRNPGWVFHRKKMVQA
ncbi:F-box/LRR-repeat protein 15-like isoform X2 [Thrips palmi]|uniref:F-box/LRR-repeat protein 15-like isoform X2 n=1 Tax=Thrips palmi TaxID=161013 RepID=A0A6P8YUR7_THRPL|nr:F-box/LRR-repeat protein 15-like isoform X2 [Thrips palmi]